MNLTALTAWAANNPWPALGVAALTAALAAAAGWTAVRLARAATRPQSAVVIAALGAIGCTGYGADTSWGFAKHYLDMTSYSERIAFFAVAELALLACSLLARANKHSKGESDTAGALVWVITGVQVIPAYAESGLVGGTVRAVIGPLMAGVLWHQAMGLEVRLVRPGALSNGLLAQIGRELRKRLLSHLGLATRDRTAEQITRDRATATVVRLASRKRLGPWGKRRLAAAVTRSRAAVDGHQRHVLMRDLAARRNAGLLRTVPVASPWNPPVPETPYPRTPLGVTGAALRTIDPLDAVRQVHAANPGRSLAEIAALCTEYGVPVTETQVRIAIGAGNPPRTEAVPAPVPETPVRPVLAAVPAPVPQPVPAPSAGETLELDLAPMGEVHPEVRAPERILAASRTRTQVHARLPQTGLEDITDFIRRRAAEEREQTAADGPVPAVPGPDVPAVPDAVPERAPGVPDPATDDLLDRAREYDAEHLRTHGRPASIRALKARFHIGQPKAEDLREQLNQPAPSERTPR